MILLDTCALLWIVSGSPRLSAAAKEQVSRHREALFVSAISAFEIGIKHAKRRLMLPMEPSQWYAEALDLHGLTELPLTGAIALRSAGLAPLHADPCDRIIVATAQVEGLVILTPDNLIGAYSDVQVVW